MWLQLQSVGRLYTTTYTVSRRTVERRDDDELCYHSSTAPIEVSRTIGNEYLLNDSSAGRRLPIVSHRTRPQGILTHLSPTSIHAAHDQYDDEYNANGDTLRYSGALLWRATTTPFSIQSSPTNLRQPVKRSTNTPIMSLH